MNIILRLGWRNIWRNPRRTILTLLAVSFPAAILVFFVSLQFSSYEASINASVSIFHGHAQIQAPGYLAKPQIRKVLPDAENLSKKIRMIPEVRGGAARAIGFGLASSSSRTYGVQVVGVEPQYEAAVSTIPRQIRQGRYLEVSQAAEAVLGTSLAKNLKVKIGDEITLLGQGKDGSVAALVLTLVGIFESGSSDIDRRFIEIPLRVFQDAYSMGQEAHTIVIVGNNFQNLKFLISEIQQIIPKELLVFSWKQLLPGLKEAIDLDMASGWLFYCCLIVIVVFSVLDTFLMSVMERTHEFGVMLALGTKPGNISRLVILESVILTGIGLLIGICIGSIVLAYYGVYGFSVPGSEEIMKHWNLPSAIHTRFSIAALSYGPLVIFFATLFAVLYPAMRVRFIEPTSAMKQ